MKKIYENRINKLLDKLETFNSEAFIIQDNWDVLYLTGFYSSKNECILIISKDYLFFITDGRFINQFNQQVKDFKLIVSSNSSSKFLETKNLLKDNNIKNIVFNFDEFSYQNFLDLEIKSSQIKNCKKLIKEIRKEKDSEEIEYIKTSGKIAEDAFLNTIKKIKIGMSEIEIQNILNFEMIKKGSERTAFPTIIASGSENGASPHAVPTDRKIESGDLITFDFGATYNNYISDITRTIAVGKISEEKRSIYNQTLKAKKECEKLLKSEVKANEVHNKAKELINETGYEFLHGVGHGIGLEVHELPVLNESSEYILKEGNTHTIEPGIYIPGLCGVRIEDDYLITKEGFECLTPNITTELINI